ncbi:MAG TPA: hypothetical protein PLF71_01475 [bacterium]|nr:MAG: hypothetical protein BWY14_00708 [Parcubacteria group bacterium ADurb.Bin192]HPN14772.1 hypothetical protein [bacterium]
MAESHLERALETERDPEDSLQGHDLYVEKCLSEINGLKSEDVGKVRAYLLDGLEKLPKNERRTALENMDNYLDQVLGLLDGKKQEGPFFYQVSKYLNKNPALAQEKDTDFLRRVTVRTYSQLFYPLVDALCEIETENLSEEYKAIKEDVQEFLSQVFPGLDEAVIQKRGNGLKFEVKSVLANEPESWESIKGFYTKGRIGIAYAERDNRGTVAHEVFHGLSDDGRTARFEDKKISGSAAKNLTEAVIEELTLFNDIDRRQGIGLYHEQRAALAELRRSAPGGQTPEIELTIFVEALFRHEPLGEKLQKIGYSPENIEEFYRKINELFG